MRALVLVLSLTAACSDNDYDVVARDLPPDAEITAPAVDSVLELDSVVRFEGVVSDDRDVARAIQTVWTLDDLVIPGADVGEAGLVSTDADLTGLLRGPHTMRLTAIDSVGHETTVQVAFTLVGAPGAPVVDITSPDDGTTIAPDVEITFRGQATDTVTAAANLQFRWYSDLDGDLTGAITADGSSILFHDSLSLGTHLVTLEVEDEDGEIGEDTVIVTIFDEPIIEEPPVVEPGDLVFSEMMINPQAVPDEVGEWIELYNTSGSPIDVQGYTLRDDDDDRWVLEGPFVVPPHGYFVLCASTILSENGGVPCDGWFYRSIYGDGMALANRPDEIVLARPDGLEIGRINYDDTWFTNAVAVGVTPSVLGTPAQFDKSQWCDQVTLTPPMLEPGTPGHENDACP